VSTDLEDTFEQGGRFVGVGRRLSGPDVQSEASRSTGNPLVSALHGSSIIIALSHKAGRTLTMTPVTRSSEGSPISLLPASVS
jgi:hypothetical protein